MVKIQCLEIYEDVEWFNVDINCGPSKYQILEAIANFYRKIGYCKYVVLLFQSGFVKFRHINEFSNEHLLLNKELCQCDDVLDVCSNLSHVHDGEFVRKLFPKHKGRRLMLCSLVGDANERIYKICNDTVQIRCPENFLCLHADQASETKCCLQGSRPRDLYGIGTDEMAEKHYRRGNDSNLYCFSNNYSERKLHLDWSVDYPECADHGKIMSLQNKTVFTDNQVVDLGRSKIVHMTVQLNSHDLVTAVSQKLKFGKVVQVLGLVMDGTEILPYKKSQYDMTTTAQYETKALSKDVCILLMPLTSDLKLNQSYTKCRQDGIMGLMHRIGIGIASKLRTSCIGFYIVTESGHNMALMLRINGCGFYMAYLLRTSGSEFYMVFRSTGNGFCWMFTVRNTGSGVCWMFMLRNTESGFCWMFTVRNTESGFCWMFMVRSSGNGFCWMFMVKNSESGYFWMFMVRRTGNRFCWMFMVRNTESRFCWMFMLRNIEHTIVMAAMIRNNGQGEIKALMHNVLSIVNSLITTFDFNFVGENMKKCPEQKEKKTRKTVSKRKLLRIKSNQMHCFTRGYLCTEKTMLAEKLKGFKMLPLKSNQRFLKKRDKWKKNHKRGKEISYQETSQKRLKLAKQHRRWSWNFDENLKLKYLKDVEDINDEDAIEYGDMDITKSVRWSTRFSEENQYSDLTVYPVRRESGRNEDLPNNSSAHQPSMESGDMDIPDILLTDLASSFSMQNQPSRTEREPFGIAMQHPVQEQVYSLAAENLNSNPEITNTAPSQATGADQVAIQESDTVTLGIDLPRPQIVGQFPDATVSSRTSANVYQPIRVRQFHNRSQTPRFPMYADHRERLRSFNGWPSRAVQSLVECGFYYAGMNECVRCFQCGGDIRNWEQVDDPWIEHAYWFPQCSFLRETKGQEFIDMMQQAAAANRRPAVSIQNSRLAGDIQNSQLAARIQTSPPADNIQDSRSAGNIQNSQLAASIQTSLSADNIQNSRPAGNIQNSQLPANIQNIQLAASIQTSSHADNIQNSRPAGNIQNSQLAANIQTSPPADSIQNSRPAGNNQNSQQAASIQTSPPADNIQDSRSVGNIQNTQLAANIQASPQAENIQNSRPVGNIQNSQLAANIQASPQAYNIQDSRPAGIIQNSHLAADIQTSPPADSIQNSRPAGNIQNIQLAANIVNRRPAVNIQTSRLACSIQNSQLAANIMNRRQAVNIQTCRLACSNQNIQQAASIQTSPPTENIHNRRSAVNIQDSGYAANIQNRRPAGNIETSRLACSIHNSRTVGNIQNCRSSCNIQRSRQQITASGESGQRGHDAAQQPESEQHIDGPIYSLHCSICQFEMFGTRRPFVASIQIRNHQCLSDNRRVDARSIDDLLEENRQLQASFRCINCKECDRNILFMPCSHLVFCRTCAQNIKICPVCEKQIQQMVRTYR